MESSNSESDISLSMECESSYSESLLSNDETDALPYLYEPNGSSSDKEAGEESTVEGNVERLNNTNWYDFRDVFLLSFFMMSPKSS